MGMKRYIGSPGGREGGRLQRVAITTAFTLSGGRSFEIEADAEQWVRCDDDLMGYVVTYWRRGMLVAAVQVAAIRRMVHRNGTTIPAGEPDPDFRPPLRVNMRDGNHFMVKEGYDDCWWQRNRRRRYRKRHVNSEIQWAYSDGNVLSVKVRDIESVLPVAVR